jgi:hypothetical protein
VVIAAGAGRWVLPGEAGADGEGTVAVRGVRALPLSAQPEPTLARLVAPLLARLLVGDPLDRDERAVIVGEVMRLWAAEAAAAGADDTPPQGGGSATSRAVTLASSA